MCLRTSCAETLTRTWSRAVAREIDLGLQALNLNPKMLSDVNCAFEPQNSTVMLQRALPTSAHEQSGTSADLDL